MRTPPIRIGYDIHLPYDIDEDLFPLNDDFEEDNVDQGYSQRDGATSSQINKQQQASLALADNFKMPSIEENLTIRSIKHQQSSPTQTMQDIDQSARVETDTDLGINAINGGSELTNKYSKIQKLKQITQSMEKIDQPLQPQQSKDNGMDVSPTSNRNDLTQSIKSSSQH